jgi:glutamine synthetase
VQAGLEGVRERRKIDLNTPRPLPTSLEAALAALEQTPAAADWLGADLFSAYLSFKRAEIKGLENLDEDEICRRYAEAY